MKDCAPGLWFTFGGWWWLKQVPYQHHIWEFGWIFNIFFWFWLLTRACRKATYRTATLFLRGKMGKGRRAPIPACIGNKTHGWNIYLLLMIHTELTLSENFWSPLPPQKCSKFFRQSLRETVQKCCDFSATFSVEKTPSPHFGQISKESVFFHSCSYTLFFSCKNPWALPWGGRKVYGVQEEKKTITKSPRSVNLYFSKDWNTISSMKYEFAQVPTVAVDQN